MAGEILRDIGTIPVADIQAGIIQWAYFVSITVASPVGVKRYTDHFESVTDDVDGGGSATWTPGWSLQVDDVRQGRELATNPTTFSVANLPETLSGPGAWTVWANSPGLTRAAVSIYVGWFDSDGALTGAVLIYEGTIGYHQVGQRAEFSLSEGGAMFRRRCVSHVSGLSPLLPAPLMPESGKKIYRTGTPPN